MKIVFKIFLNRLFLKEDIEHFFTFNHRCSILPLNTLNVPKSFLRNDKLPIYTEIRYFCTSSFQNEINFQTRCLELFYPNPQDCSTMINQKDTVSKKLQEQQDKLSQLEEKLSQLLTGSHRRRSADSGTITWSDEDTITTNKVPIH